MNCRRKGKENAWVWAATRQSPDEIKRMTCILGALQINLDAAVKTALESGFRNVNIQPTFANQSQAKTTRKLIGNLIYHLPYYWKIITFCRSSNLDLFSQPWDMLQDISISCKSLHRHILLQVHSLHSSGCSCGILFPPHTLLPHHTSLPFYASISSLLLSV